MKQWIERLKQPPSWRALRVMNAVTAVVGITFAIIAENRWVALTQAFLAGTGVAGVLHSTGMIRLRASIDGMHQAFSAMVELNGALIQDKVQFILHEEPNSDDDAPPISPSLH